MRVFGAAGVPRAATVVPAGMEGPVTYIPTMIPAALARLMVVVFAIVPTLLWLRSFTRKLDAVVFALMLKVVGPVMPVIVAPTGIPGPLTGWPTARPEVLPTVTTFERPSVFALNVWFALSTIWLLMMFGLLPEAVT